MNLDVYIADTRTGRIWEKLDGAGGTTGDALNGDGVTGRFDVPVFKGLRGLLDQPWKASIVVADDQRVYAAHPVPDAVAPPRGGRVAINGSSIWSVLDHRPAWKTTAAPPSTAADLSFTGSLAQIAAQLITAALAWGALPIVVPSLASLPAGDNLRNYLSYDMNGVGSRLKNLTDNQGGRLDVHFDCQWKDGNNNYFEWVPRFGFPLTGPVVPWIWDEASDAVVSLGEEVDGELFASDVWMAGGGTERTKVIGHGRSALPEQRGGPAIHRFDTSSHDSVVLQATADGYAQGMVRDGLILARQVQPTVRTDMTPRFGQWQLGDQARFDVQDSDWWDDGSYAGQVYSWSHTLGSDQVNLTLANQSFTPPTA